MATKIQPLADYVVAQQEEAETKTASGLYIPGGSQEKPKVAKVLAIGSTVANVKVGDRIIYGGYSNTDIKMDGETFMLIKEENIFATIK
jgi:chaperonin GroES